MCKDGFLICKMASRKVRSESDHPFARLLMSRGSSREPTPTSTSEISTSTSREVSRDLSKTTVRNSISAVSRKTTTEASHQLAKTTTPDITKASRDISRTVSAVSTRQMSRVPTLSARASRPEPDSDLDIWSDKSPSKRVNCISCQRRGRKSSAAYYCQDCKIGLCVKCTDEHKEIRLNRHSISTISKTFHMSPNQGPFPELTVIGTIKMDEELYLRGSTFLPNGELVTADFHNAKIRVYSSDYTRKLVSSFLIPKDHNFELKRPKPFDLTSISNDCFAFTAENGCIYILKMGNTRIIKIDRMIGVIDFTSNFGECLGLAYNDVSGYLYVGCSGDREGVFIKVYDLDGNPVQTVRDGIVEAPDYLTFGANKSKLYSADSDSVTVYEAESFEEVEKYPELQAQIRDLFLDKYGYTYCLALERRTYNSAGSIYRLDINTGVTKVAEMDDKPASISYSYKTDTVTVTFVKSRYIYLYKLALRSYQKAVDAKLRPYKKSK